MYGVVSQAYADASFSGLNAQIDAGSGATGWAGVSAGASVDVTFDEWVEITGGSGPGTLTGTYSYYSLAHGDGFIASAPIFVYSIEQGGVGSSSDSTATGPFPLSIMVSSSFIYDDAFEITENISDYTTIPGDTSASFYDYGASYVDQNDDPVGFIVVPEPGSYLLVGLGFVLMSVAAYHPKA
jgi:hypothetical protein